MCDFEAFLPFAFGGVSFLSIIVIAIDRYNSIVRRCYFTDMQMRVIVGVIWLGSFGMFSIGVFLGDPAILRDEITCEINFVTRNPINLGVLWIMVICVIVGLPMVFAIYTRITFVGCIQMRSSSFSSHLNNQ